MVCRCILEFPNQTKEQIGIHATNCLGELIALGAFMRLTMILVWKGKRARAYTERQ